MSKKLKIGKTEVVIYPENGHTYVIPKDISGLRYDKQFSSSNLPRELTAVCIGREEIKGVLHDKYILKEIPKELKELWLYGEPGYSNLSVILDSVAGILRGETEDGRRIKYVRSMIVEDINKLFNITVDFKNQKVYQKGIGKNINRRENFGKSLNIDLYFNKKEIEIIRKHIKGEYINFTSYYYYKEDLQVEEYLKNLIFLNNSYYLNSPGVYDSSDGAIFGPGVVLGGYVFRGVGGLFISDGDWNALGRAVRPVFYLESNIQDEIIEEQQEEKELKVDKNEAKNKVEIKKENTLKEPQENKDLEILNKIKEKREKLANVKKDIVEQQEKLANAQKHIVEKQEKVTVLEKNIAKQQEELKKEKEELQKMVNEALELV